MLLTQFKNKEEEAIKIDFLNIDLEEEDNLQYRDVDESEFKSDFDEVRGLGRPSIDSFTINEIDLDFLKDE